MLLIVFPGLMLGIAPIVASIWFNKLSDRFASSLAEVWSAILLAALVALGWFGGRRYFDLPSAASGPSTRSPFSPSTRHAAKHYVISVAHRLAPDATATQRSRLHATTAVMSGVVICGIALLALMLAWPSSHLSSDIAILSSPKRLAMVALANSVVLVSAYVAAAALVWAIADATMDPPHDLEAFGRVLTRRARGASHICRIFTSSASATASESRAAGRGRAATSG